MDAIFSWLGQNYQITIILMLLVDKFVAMSNTKMDDLIWFSLKKIIKKVLGK